MAEKKRSRTSTQNRYDDESKYFLIANPEPIEIASGCSISVKYDANGMPLIYVKKFGDADIKGLRREIERNYPGALIQGLEKSQINETIDAKEKECKKPRAKHRKAQKRKI